MQTTNEKVSLDDSAKPFTLSDPRVDLAAERTLLAWVRTGLALMGFGFVVARFGLFLRELAETGGHRVPAGHGGSLALGVALVGMGVWVLVVSAMRYRTYISALIAGQTVRPPGPLFTLGVAASLALLGLFMALYLVIIG